MVTQAIIQSLVILFYDFDATDIDGGDYGNFINWSIQGIDADKFYMDTWTGQLFLSSNPDYEKSSYLFEVIASDGIDQSTKSITLNIDDIDEALQGIGTYWEIQEDNNIHWIDLVKT